MESTHSLGPILVWPVLDELEMVRGYGHLGPVQREYVRHAYEGTSELPDMTSAVPESSYSVVAWATQYAWGTLVIDIEWTPGSHIRQVGFTHLETMQTLVIPLRDQEGSSVWPRVSDQGRIDAGLRVLLQSPTTKVFHNAPSDMATLSAYGLEIAGPVVDTLALHSMLWPDLRQGLEFCSVLWCGAVPWKHLSKVKWKKGVMR